MWQVITGEVTHPSVIDFLSQESYIRRHSPSTIDPLTSTRKGIQYADTNTDISEIASTVSPAWIARMPHSSTGPTASEVTLPANEICCDTRPQPDDG